MAGEYIAECTRTSAPRASSTMRSDRAVSDVTQRRQRYTGNASCRATRHAIDDVGTSLRRSLREPSSLGWSRVKENELWECGGMGVRRGEGGRERRRSPRPLAGAWNELVVMEVHDA